MLTLTPCLRTKAQLTHKIGLIHILIDHVLLVKFCPRGLEVFAWTV